MKKIFNKDTLKRAGLFTLAGLLPLFSIITLALNAYALDSFKMDIENIKANYDNSARAEHALYKLYQCANNEGGDLVNGGWWAGYWGDGYNYSTLTDGGLFYHESINIFDGSADIFLSSLSAGRWLEEMVQGSYGDGKIDCGDNNDKIIEVVAKLIFGSGATKMDILCDHSNPGAPGLLKNENGGTCGDKKAEYVKNPNWQNYFMRIYDDYIKDKSDYPVTWSVLSGAGFKYTHVDGYYLYTNEIERGCGGKVSGPNETNEPPSASHLDEPLKRVDSYGNVTYEWYAGNGTKALSESGFVSAADGWTCAQYIARANHPEMFDQFRNIILEGMEKGCYETRKTQVDDAEKRFNEKISALTPEEKEQNKEAIEKDQAILDQAHQLFTAYEGGDKTALVETYKDESGKSPAEPGWMCKVIEGLEDIGMKDYVIDTPDEEIQPGTVETGPTCYDRAASLGWILCPIIEQVADAIQYIYEQIIMPFLELDIGLFASNNATHDVWSKIRDMANIGFIIFFIFVIFSQLTGVGIDNYGIKKVLPKLIVGAILINLSYVICQLSVDLSNILGYGIKSIFEGLSPKIDEITVAQEGAFGTGNTHSVAGTFILLIGIVAAITAGAILALGPHILIPVFMGLISIVIAIIFCFILLAVRKAFAVLLVIISPLAFMCYILPNTKSLFDKWFNAFKAMLLAFPICSAMIYGGQFVGSLIIDAASATNVPFTLALCAAVISVMPVFMIPKVIRGSMAMISNGLTRMQGSLTGRARGAAAHGLNNSRMMTRYDQNRAAKRAARQTAYNAKKGQRYIDRQNRKGNADLTKMSPAARAAYLNAQGGVDAQDKQMQDAWSTKFSEMEKGDEGRANSLIEMANNGKLDKNALIAGMSSISDSDQMTRAFNAIHGSANGKALLKDSKTRSAVAGSLKSSKSVINQSMGKLVAKSPDGTFTHEELRKKVQEAGTSVMASQDKDTFKSEGAMDLFSKEQLAAGMGAGYSGADAAAFSQMMMGDETKAAEALSAMSASQVAGMSTDMFKSKEEGGMGSEFIKNNVSKDAINTLNSEDGARLRASMNAQVKEALGITGDGGSSSGTTPAPAPENDGGGSTGGGWVDDSGNPITSPAQLTDDDLRYANKLKEMSQRGSDGSTLSVDHDSSSATSEPMRGEHGRGINDATGKERAAEGNRLDYHPKMKGETNADYSARAQWEKEMTRRAEAAGPRDSAKETPSQWQTRAGIESFESWRGKQNR